MLLLAALLAAAAADPAPQTAVDAERAFASMAAREGQWKAFIAWSTPDAVIFTPQPANAHETLRAAREPRVPVQWWPAESYVSCDGTLAVNTGPWVRPGGSVGYFTTVWQRQADGGWKWIMDGGDELQTPRATGEQPKVETASCTRNPGPEIRGTMDAASRSGKSADGSLSWFWRVSRDGARRFEAAIWDGRRYRTVVADTIAAPPAR